MLTKIAHVVYQDRARWGIIDQTRIHFLDKPYSSTSELLADKNQIIALANNRTSTLENSNLTEVELLSPVTGNPRVICQGANYRQHMRESGMDPEAKNFNMFFNKSSASICAARDDIIKPEHVSLLDYEIELGLVIGKKIQKKTHISDENLSDYIAGIVISNDVSARDIQIPESQFFKGKSYRTFCPVGPYLCLLDSHNIHQIHALKLELKVNGTLRQQDHTGNWVYPPSETLTELSGFSDLDVGDLILTGTPSGCALQIPSPMIVRLFSLLPEPIRWRLFKRIQGKRADYLNIGDQVEARIFSEDHEIDLGCQRNMISGPSTSGQY